MAGSQIDKFKEQLELLPKPFPLARIKSCEHGTAREAENVEKDRDIYNQGQKIEKHRKE